MSIRSFGINIGDTYGRPHSLPVTLLNVLLTLLAAALNNSTRSGLGAAFPGGGQLLARRLQDLLGDMLFDFAGGRHGQGHVAARNAVVQRLAEVVLETRLAIAGDGRPDRHQFLDCRGIQVWTILSRLLP